MATSPVTRLVLPLLGGALLLTATVSATSAATPQAAVQATAMLVHTAQRAKFGLVLTNGTGFALYTWNHEKSGKVTCVGACAKTWPPLLVPAGASVPKTIAGVMGHFSIVMRPDGKHQVAFNGHPLYTFASDTTPTTILCNGVDGWYVVRVTH